MKICRPPRGWSEGPCARRTWRRAPRSSSSGAWRQMQPARCSGSTPARRGLNIAQGDGIELVAELLGTNRVHDRREDLGGRRDVRIVWGLFLLACHPYLLDGVRDPGALSYGAPEWITPRCKECARSRRRTQAPQGRRTTRRSRYRAGEPRRSSSFAAAPTAPQPRTWRQALALHWQAIACTGRRSRTPTSPLVHPGEQASKAVAPQGRRRRGGAS